MGVKKAARKLPLGVYLRKTQAQRARIKSTFKPKTVFVIMAFDGTGRTYSAIKEECEKLGLAAMRADENVGSGLIIQEIFDHIQEAEFIICDLTNGRPNVYYELGYAHGIGNSPENILLLAKAGTALSFDISSFRVKNYRSSEELRSLVSSDLKRFIQLGSQAKSTGHSKKR
jgi:hypothetical protein